MDPSPPTDRQYIDFNSVFLYKAGTYATGTRYLRGPVLDTGSLESIVRYCMVPLSRFF